MLNKLLIEFVPGFVGAWLVEILAASVFAQRRQLVACRGSVT
jgi:hypothetical protein